MVTRGCRHERIIGQQHIATVGCAVRCKNPTGDGAGRGGSFKADPRLKGIGARAHLACQIPNETSCRGPRSAGMADYLEELAHLYDGALLVLHLRMDGELVVAASHAEAR